MPTQATVARLLTDTAAAADLADLDAAAAAQAKHLLDIS